MDIVCELDEETGLLYLSQHSETGGVQLRLLQLHHADPPVLVQVLLVIIVT